MHLAVDARLLQRGGIGTYLREIVAPWLRDPGRCAPGLERLTLLGRPDELGPWLAHHPTPLSVRTVGWEDEPYAPAAHLRFPLSLAPRLRAVDHLFFPHWDVPFYGVPAPFTVTVHDLTHFLMPDHFPGWKRWMGIRVLRRAVARAASVLTVSRRTGADLERMGVEDPRRVRVIPNGVGEAYTPEGPRGGPELEGRHPYLLLVGWDRPHKNAELAVRVVAELNAPTLALVGAGGRMQASVQRLAGKLGVTDRVAYLGDVPHERLPALYRGAAAVLVPSLYEGFGLPALEGMACGAPVLVSDRGALPEVAGPARVLPADDVVAWVRAVEELLADPGDRAPGVAHARTFSWEGASSAVFQALVFPLASSPPPSDVLLHGPPKPPVR